MVIRQPKRNPDMLSVQFITSEYMPAETINVRKHVVTKLRVSPLVSPMCLQQSRVFDGKTVFSQKKIKK